MKDPPFMAYKEFTPEQTKRFLELYDKGYSASKIAFECHVSTRKASLIIKIIVEARGEYLPDHLKGKAREEKMIEMFVEGKTAVEVAALLGVSTRTVRLYRARWGQAPKVVKATDQVNHAEVIRLWALGEMSQADIARHLGVSAYTISQVIAENKPKMGGTATYREPIMLAVPKEGCKRYIFTCAQNNTAIHQPVWKSLLRLAKHYDAEIFVASFNYNRAAYGTLSVKRGTDTHENKELWYDREIVPYLDKSDNRLQLSPHLVWCGEVNLSPTLTRPLSGFENYTQMDSSIFPHPRLAMKSVATLGNSGPKLVYTTGTITQRNYIQKTAGLKAEFHHSYGGLLVEVNSDGSFYIRQLTSSDDGIIQDLNVVVDSGKLTSKKAIVSSINWGDIHVAYLQEDQKRICWGKGGILDTLKPEHQFFHDTLDFYARNHHEVNDPHSFFKRFVNGTDSVEKEVDECAKFLLHTKRDWCKSIIVESNHDNAFERWLVNGYYDYRKDPLNARYFLECQLRKYQAIENKEERFLFMEWAIRRSFTQEEPGIIFLDKDQSFVINGVEFGLHGHNAPNGARGSPLGFSKLGFPVNLGHFHSAEILDGVFVAGLTANLKMDYNKGPSSWGHSHIITYPTGMRAIITTWRGAWRA